MADLSDVRREEVKAMSADTPRTDEVARMPTDAYPNQVVDISFARQLEQELNEAKAELMELQTIGLDVRSQKEIVELRACVSELEREVKYLRAYGNKDCTNMADAAMETGEMDTP